MEDSGEGPGGARKKCFGTVTAPLISGSYLYAKLRPERPKKIFGRLAPALSQGLDDRASPIIRRSGSATDKEQKKGTEDKKERANREKQNDEEEEEAD